MIENTVPFANHTPPAGAKFRMVNPGEDNKFIMRYLQAQTREDAKAEMMAIVAIAEIKQCYVEEFGDERIIHTYP